MAWRFVVQPNGKLARFSEVVDSFTHQNLSRPAAEHLCGAFGLGKLETEDKINAAHQQPARWLEALKEIERVHGKAIRHMCDRVGRGRS